jgi:hypothetical protein
MKKVFLWMTLACASSSLFSGIDSETLVETSQGRIKMGALKIGSELMCHSNPNTRTWDTVKSIEGHEVDKYLQVCLAGGNKLDTLPDERVWVSSINSHDPETGEITQKPFGKWVKVSGLRPGYVVMAKNKKKTQNAFLNCFFNENVNLDSNEIVNVRKKYGRKIFNYIVLNNIHNYVAGQEGIVTHNGPFLGICGYWITKGLCYTGVVGGVAVGVTAGTMAAGPGLVGFVAGGTAGGAGAVGGAIAGGSAATTIVSGIVGGGIAVQGTAGAIAVGATTGAATSAGLTAGATATAVAVATQIEVISISVMNFLNLIPWW